MNHFIDILNLIRAKNWIKNLLIFVPICFSSLPITKNLIFGLFDLFFCISVLSSIVYIINDIADLESDELDLIKKKRPIASGKITKKNSLIVCLILMSLLISYVLFKHNNLLNLILLYYFLLNLGYTFFLKFIFLLDVVVLSLFYIIRVVAPIYYFNLTFSIWLITIMFFAISAVGFGKRYMDIKNNENNIHFSSIYKKKNLVFLIIFFAIVLQILFFLFSNSENTLLKFGELFYLSSIIVFAGTSRYLYSLFKKNFSDPIEIFIKDKILLTLVIFFAIYSVYSIYNI